MQRGVPPSPPRLRRTAHAAALPIRRNSPDRARLEYGRRRRFATRLNRSSRGSDRTWRVGPARSRTWRSSSTHADCRRATSKTASTGVGRPGRASSSGPPVRTRSPCPLVNEHEVHRPNVEDATFGLRHTKLGEKQPLPLFGSFLRAYLLRAAPVELISRVDLPCRLIVPQNARSSHRPGVPFCEPHSITQPPPSPPARSPTPEGRSRANNDAC